MRDPYPRGVGSGRLLIGLSQRLLRRPGPAERRPHGRLETVAKLDLQIRDIVQQLPSQEDMPRPPDAPQRPVQLLQYGLPGPVCMRKDVDRVCLDMDYGFRDGLMTNRNPRKPQRRQVVLPGRMQFGFTPDDEHVAPVHGSPCRP